MLLSAILATALSLIAANCTGLRGQQLVDCRQSEVDQYGDADAYYNLALAHEDGEDWTAAADAWAEAKRLDPQDPDISKAHQQCLARGSSSEGNHQARDNASDDASDNASDTASDNASDNASDDASDDALQLLC